MPCSTVLAALFCSAASVVPLDAGFTELFNRRDLSGWVHVTTGPSTWTVRDGTLVCSGRPTGLLRTERMYENFILEMEWKHLSPTGNAGLFVWSDGLPARGQPFTRAVEVQVMLGGEGDWYTSQGDIFPIFGAVMTPENPRPKGGSRAFPTESRTRPAGEWNHYRVECRDGDISLAVNGKVVTRGRSCSPRRGYICLESEGSEVHFRNLRVQELPTTDPPLPAEHIAAASDGFVPLFTGDFTGWKFGPAHEGHWKAEDWSIVFDGEGDDLWTERPYRDFVLIADWRWMCTPEEAPETDRPVILPSGEQAVGDDGKPRMQRVRDGGDSGIYLRGSSKSQVNMWCWPIGSGEVYGYRVDPATPADVRAAVTPKLAADAPIGKWNRFIITMKGDRLSVELNGKRVIEDAHLPGVAAEGPIALQKHGSRVQFANLLIKELK